MELMFGRSRYGGPKLSTKACVECNQTFRTDTEWELHLMVGHSNLRGWARKYLNDCLGLLMHLYIF